MPQDKKPAQIRIGRVESLVNELYTRRAGILAAFPGANRPDEYAAGRIEELTFLIEKLKGEFNLE